MRGVLLWLIAWLFAGALRASELTLVADRAEGPVRLERLGAGRLVGKSGSGSISVPLSAPLRVEGDLAANLPLAYWPSFYFVQRPPARDGIAEQNRPWFAYLRMVEGRGWNGTLFGQIWKKDVGETALVVFAWVVQGRIVRVHAAPLPGKSARENFRVDHLFQLSAEEAKGCPMVLLWSDGRFVAPVPLFKEPPLAEIAAAVLLHDEPRLRAALKPRLRLDSLSPEGWTPVELAVSSGNLKALDLLLAAGAKADPWFSADPLNFAARHGRLEMVARLLGAKADPNRARGDAVPLQHAVRAGHEEVARLLVEHGTKLEHSSSLVAKPLRQAIEAGFADLARLMWAKGAKEPVPPEERADVLWDCVKRGQTAMVELLLERTWSPDAVRDGRSALWLAVRTRNRPLAAALLRAGAKPDGADATGTTPLMLAAAAGDLDLVRLLLDAGASPLTKRRDGHTAVHLAAIQLEPALVETLSAKDADLQAPGAGGARLLDMALLYGATDTARWLVAHGARGDFKGASASAVLENAIALDLAPVLADALAKGWTVDTPIAGRSLMQLAQLAGAKQCAQLLLAAGVASGAEPAAWCGATALDRPPETLRSPPPPDLREPEARVTAQTVDVEIDLDERGAVFAVRVREKADRRAAFAALRAARATNFSPPTRAGVAVRTTLVRSFVFPAVADQVVDEALVDVAPRPITRWLADVRPWNQNSGDLVVRCVVDKHGAATEVEVVKAPDAEHARSALRVVPSWSFTPGLKNGVPVGTRTEFSVPVVF